MGGHTRSYIQPGLLTHISEWGYGSIPDLEDNILRYRREGNSHAAKAVRFQHCPERHEAMTDRFSHGVRPAVGRVAAAHH